MSEYLQLIVVAANIEAQKEQSEECQPGNSETSFGQTAANPGGMPNKIKSAILIPGVRCSRIFATS